MVRQEEASDETLVINFGDSAPTLPPAAESESRTPSKPDEKDDDEVPPLVGLWGGFKPAADAGPKRRWTVNER